MSQRVGKGAPAALETGQSRTGLGECGGSSHCRELGTKEFMAEQLEHKDLELSNRSSPGNGVQLKPVKW